MQVVDLADEHRELFICCLEDWSEDIKEGCVLKERWFDKMIERGLRAELALDDAGEAGGMIQYLPIEQSTAEGSNLYFIPCIWVHGHKQGRGNFQGKGMGSALLAAAEEDAKSLGGEGMAAWGLRLPFWMRASWFRKHGYREADRDGIAALMWKPFADGAQPPRWIKPKKKPEPVPGKVSVTSFANGWCTGQNLVCERARRAAAELGENVLFREIDTSERQTLLEWGIADALFIDGRAVRTGPPPSYEKIKGLIARRLKKIAR